MARVDFTGVPEVEARQETPDDLQHIEAPPSSFGAAAAEGAEQLGAGAIDAAKFYSSVAANDSTNNFLDQRTKLLYGDPSKPVATDASGSPVTAPDGSPVYNGGFFSLRGADALRAAPEVTQQLNDIIQHNREGLSTPLAQEQYETDTRRYRAQTLQDIGTHADQQMKVYATDTNNTSALLALNAVGRTPNDPDAIAAQQENVNRAYVRNAQLAGQDPKGALLKAQQDVALVRIKSLIISDPQAAQKLLDSDSGILASRPDYDQIGRAVKEASQNSQIGPATINAISNARTRAAGLVGNVGAPVPLKDAILGQESGGNPNAPTSVNGAVGIGQMKPETFAQFANPGEVITNSKDNEAVAGRAIDAYSQQYNGDAARVAVAYFSGPGNVAPAGSATPYLHDYKDGNGKSVSSYVSDIQNRTQAKSYPSVVDALRGTEDQTLQQAQAKAVDMFPNYPDAQERYVEGVRRGLDQTIAQQEQQYTIDTHIVQQAMAGPHPPLSPEALRAISPQVAQSYDNMLYNAPYARMNLDHMFDAGARGVARTYGTDIYSYLQGIAAPVGDPKRVNSVDQLWGSVDGRAGEKSPITNTGVSIGSDLLKLRSQPGGEGTVAQIGKFLNSYHQLQTGTAYYPGLKNEAGERRFNDALLTMLPAIITGLKNSKMLGELTDPNKADYVGNGLAKTDQIPGQSQLMQENFDAVDNMTPEQIAAAGVKKFENGKIYRDAKGNRATYNNGNWEPVK
jgi:hypothetical protein